MLKIVLVDPDIPWNTGNIGRTCLAIDAELHLVGKLGFSIDDAQVRRSGLDYWHQVKVQQHASLNAFLETQPPESPRFLFSTKGQKSLWEAEFKSNSILIFGPETTGLSAEIRQPFKDHVYRIPQVEGMRSLNLSTAVGIAVYEAERQCQRMEAIGNGQSTVVL